MKAALRELGGDFAGLIDLLRAHRVPASPWLQPVLLLAAAALILLTSPAPRTLIEGVIGTALSSADRRAVILAASGWTPAERVITAAEFETIRTLPILSRVERYRPNLIRARAERGVSLSAIQSELHARMGNRIGVLLRTKLYRTPRKLFGCGASKIR